MLDNYENSEFHNKDTFFSENINLRFGIYDTSSYDRVPLFYSNAELWNHQSRYEPRSIKVAISYNPGSV